MTHYERIKNHLETYGSITSWEAIKEYGCTRLSQYIYLLRKNGFKISSQNETVINRFGDKVNYFRYKLGEKEGNKNETN